MTRAARRPSKALPDTTKNQDLVRRFTWEIASINVHLEELRQFWARALGISGPQWMIIMALADLDKKGFLRRKSSTSDARVVQMSLTDKTRKHLAALAAQQDALNDFIFEEFDDRELSAFTDKLAALKVRLEKARLRVAL